MAILDLSNKEILNVNWKDTLNGNFCAAAPLAQDIGYCRVTLNDELKIPCITDTQLKEVMPKDNLIAKIDIQQDTSYLKVISVRLKTDDINYLVGFCSELSSRIKEMLPCQK